MKDFKENIAKRRQIALYANLTIDDYVAVWEVRYSDVDEHYERLPNGEVREQSVNGWVRISAPIEVNFTSVDNDTIIRNAVLSLDQEERKVREELNRKITEIQERKQQLLALAYQPDPVS